MAQSAQGRAGPSPERAGLAEVRAVHRGPSFSRLLLVPAVTRRGPWVVWGTAAAEGAGTKCSQNQFWALGRGGHGDSRLCSRRMGAARPGSQPAGAQRGPCAPGASGSGSQAALCQLAHPLHPGVGPQGVLEHKIPEHLHPRVVLRQVVVVLGRDLPHLQGGERSGAAPAQSGRCCARVREHSDTHERA